MRSKFGFAAGAVFFIGSIVAQAQYTTLVGFDDLHVGNEFTHISSYAFDGDTLYVFINGIESNVSIYWEPQITKVEDFLGTPVATELVDFFAWAKVSDPNLLDPNDPNQINPNQFNPDNPDVLDPNMPLSASPPLLHVSHTLAIDGQLQFLDGDSNAIWRMDTTTGAIVPFVTNEAIRLHTGLEEADLLDMAAISPWNDMAFFDEFSNSVISVDPNGVLTTLLDPNDFADLYDFLPTKNMVSGGLAYDHRGVLYWSLNRSSFSGSAGGAIYKLECDGTTSRVLAQDNIWDVTLSFGNVGFGDLSYAPDGNLYFYELNSDGILYFDPNDPRLPWPTSELMPDDLLYEYLTRSELYAGPMSDPYVGPLIPFGSYLTWCGITKASADIYSAPLAGPVIAQTDYNRDTWVNEIDLDLFLDDYTAPEVAYDPNMSVEPPDCRGFLPTDIDEDGDVDLHDLPPLQTQYTGS